MRCSCSQVFSEAYLEPSGTSVMELSSYKSFTVFTKKLHQRCRSSHQRCSMKKSVFRNFPKFIGKQLCQSLFFNKVAGLELATLIKKRLWHKCFPVNFATLKLFLVFREAGLAACNSIKWHQHRCFPVNVANF